MAEPKVRFKRDDESSYPAWGTRSFSETFDALNNNTYSREMLNYDSGDAKNIHYGDILVKFGDICDIQKDSVPYVNKGLTVQKYASLKDGDIILADTAEDETVGKAIEIYNTKNDVVISGLHTMVCRPFNSFAPKYLGYYMNSQAFHNQLRPFMQGIKVTSIGRSNIAEIKISSPSSFEEQQKIADFLSSVDEVITASEEEVANLEKQKKAAMKKIFSQEVRFKKADGSDFPEWEEKTFEDIFDVITDYVAAGSFADIAKNVQYIDKPDYAQLVRTVDVKNGFRNKGFVYVDKRAFDYLYRVELDKEPHIILPNIGANIGEYYLVEPSDLPYERNVLGPNAIMLGTDNDIYFWAQYLGSENFQKNLALIVSSTGQPKFNKTDLRKVAMVSPCEEEQRLIADFLSDFDEAIAAAKKELELWKELKKGLLQQMFV